MEMICPLSLFIVGDLADPALLSGSSVESYVAEMT